MSEMHRSSAKTNALRLALPQRVDWVRHDAPDIPWRPASVGHDTLGGKRKQDARSDADAVQLIEDRAPEFLQGRLADHALEQSEYPGNRLGGMYFGERQPAKVLSENFDDAIARQPAGNSSFSRSYL